MFLSFLLQHRLFLPKFELQPRLFFHCSGFLALCCCELLLRLLQRCTELRHGQHIQTLRGTERRHRAADWQRGRDWCDHCVRALWSGLRSVLQFIFLLRFFFVVLFVCAVFLCVSILTAFSLPVTTAVLHWKLIVLIGNDFVQMLRRIWCSFLQINWWLRVGKSSQRCCHPWYNGRVALSNIW